MNVELFAKLVFEEIVKRKNSGNTIPERALEVSQDIEEMESYVNMDISECADLIISLAQIDAI